MFGTDLIEENVFSIHDNDLVGRLNLTRRQQIPYKEVLSCQCEEYIYHVNLWIILLTEDVTEKYIFHLESQYIYTGMGR